MTPPTPDPAGAAERLRDLVDVFGEELRFRRDRLAGLDTLGTAGLAFAGVVLGIAAKTVGDAHGHPSPMKVVALGISVDAIVTTGWAALWRKVKSINPREVQAEVEKDLSNEEALKTMLRAHEAAIQDTTNAYLWKSVLLGFGYVAIVVAASLVALAIAL